MSTQFVITAEPRASTGTAASRRMRLNGQVPAVIYGGDEAAQYLVLQHNQIQQQLSIEAFHSALLQIKIGDDMQRAVLRAVQMHPHRQQVLHLDFQRVSRKDKLTMTVPLHFIGEDQAPGVKLEHGIMTHGRTTIDIYCLATDLPEYVEVNVSHLSIGESLHLSDVQLPQGVEFASTVHASDMELAIASVLAPKKPQLDEEQETAAQDDESSAAAESAADEDE